MKVHWSEFVDSIYYCQYKINYLSVFNVSLNPAPLLWLLFPDIVLADRAKISTCEKFLSVRSFC